MNAYMNLDSAEILTLLAAVLIAVCVEIARLLLARRELEWLRKSGHHHSVYSYCRIGQLCMQKSDWLRYVLGLLAWVCVACLSFVLLGYGKAYLGRILSGEITIPNRPPDWCYLAYWWYLVTGAAITIVLELRILTEKMEEYPIKSRLDRFLDTLIITVMFWLPVALLYGCIMLWSWVCEPALEFAHALLKRLLSAAASKVWPIIGPAVCAFACCAFMVYYGLEFCFAAPFHALGRALGMQPKVHDDCF